jgi:phospholipase D1/2
VKILPLKDHRLFWAAAATIVALAAITAAWKFTPLADWLTAERVVEWVETFSTYWWAPYALALLYTPASIILFPRPLLTVAAAVAFGPWKGFAVAMGGVLLNALLGYIAGRQLDPRIVKRCGGAKMDRVGKALRKEGFLAVATVGLVPIAPFFVEMLAFGALRLKLWHVLLGVALANTPGVLGGTLLGDQLHAVLSSERTLNLWVVGAVVAVLVFVGFATHRLWVRMQAA